jgi:hypothetical protein
MRRHFAAIQRLEMWRLEPADASRPQDLFGYRSDREGRTVRDRRQFAACDALKT